MATIAEQLTSLANTKTAIKDAIVAKGVAVADTDTFASYPAKIAEISGGGSGTKFGVPLNVFLGNLNEDGELTKINEVVDVDLTGVKVLNVSRIFAYFSYNTGGVTRIYAPDLIECKVEIGPFSGDQRRDGMVELYFPKLEKVAASMFNYFVNNTNATVLGNFGSLKKIDKGSVFSSFGTSTKTELIQRMFPVLETIHGVSVFSGAFGVVKFFPELTDVYGANGTTDVTSAYSAPLGATANPVFLPKCTRVPTYLVNNKQIVIHFAIKNQAVIEACAGYSNNFGGGSVLFDLVSSITVDGIVYDRSESDSITETFEKFYTAWKSADGAIVYTYDGNYTVEPAVGTAVFSDAGVTQVGTVSAIE